MFTLTVNTSELEQVIRRLENAGEMRLNIMRGFSGILLAAIARGVREESDPVTGIPWAELSPVTIARRAKKGHAGKKLQVSGQLAASFGESELSERHVVVGSNKEYAPTLHFGAKKGAFGVMSIIRTRQAVPIPWGDIPDRPLLPIGENGQMNAVDEEDIMEILQNNIRAVFEA